VTLLDLVLRVSKSLLMTHGRPQGIEIFKLGGIEISVWALR
jgi:hypothetical protein